MKTLEIELFVKKRDCKTYDLCPEASLKGAMSDMRAGEFPQLKAITTDNPLRAKLIIEMPAREEGYYWVKKAAGGAYGNWQIGLWSPNRWYLACNGIGFDDCDFTEIDERRIERVAQ